MQDPHEVLGLSLTADDATVRKRYLELVRRHPPDQAPERFAQIRTAYEQLCDPVARLEAEIFQNRSSSSLDEIMADVRQRIRGKRIPVEVLLSLGDS